MNLFADLGEICRPKVRLGPMTWFRIGGPADWLVEPRDEEDLAVVAHRCREADMPLRVLGLGANLLIGDGGVRGAVLRLASPHFQRIEIEGERVTAGAGAHLTKLVKGTVGAGLAGLEALAGIPGTVGGGVRMNCGGKYGELASSVEGVRVLGARGGLREKSRGELGFSYRHSELGEDVVLSATFSLKTSDAREVQERYREIWRYKAETQPPLEDCSAGCIFKNPKEGPSAGKLIDESGLKGTRVGGAEVSDIHANFIVTHDGAKAADVVRLIEQIEERVLARTGVRLQREVQIW